MSELSADQLAQRIYDCGLMGNKELEQTLANSGGRGRASFNDFIMTLLESEQMTNWQISRVVDGQRRGYFYNKWKVLYLIGAGTFARVYRAVHSETGEIKAVKVLRQRFSDDAETRESFLREARVVMDLRHPNIVPIFEVDNDKARIYMVMDFVEGQNLREYVRAHRKIPYITALKITRDVAAGLAHAAKFNVYHRDMKLSNVLLSSRGVGKLVDFGLATVTSDDGKGGPRSIDYAGLERCTKVKRNDTRSDIFFVGCMLYHMVTGEPAMSETRERMKRLAAGRFRDIKPVTIHDPDLPHRLVNLINRLTEIDPEKRIQTAKLVEDETASTIKAIESGDLKKYDENLSKQEAQAYEKMISKQDEGRGKTLLLIESNVKVQNSLRERLKGIGYRVLITSDPVRGLARFSDLDPAEELPADCVLFGCAGLGKDGVRAFEKFAKGEYTSELPAVLFAMEKLQRFVKPELLNEHRLQLPLPIKFKHVQLGLRKLLKLPAGQDQPSAGNAKTETPVEDASQDTDVDLND